MLLQWSHRASHRQASNITHQLRRGHIKHGGKATIQFVEFSLNPHLYVGRRQRCQCRIAGTLSICMQIRDPKTSMCLKKGSSQTASDAG